jgi:hypothetical protein
MRPVVLFLLLLTTPAWAGWKNVGDDPLGTLYADTDGIVRDGSLVRMQWLLDYSSFRRMVEVGYFSQRTRAEFDCREARMRVLDVALLADHMGQGKEVYADDSPRDWESVEAGSSADKLRAAACRR